MRRMSFALTTDAVRNRTKTVTRRLGWTFLKPGDRLLAVDKLRTKNAQKLGVIEVVNVRRESLSAIQHADVKREGFPDMARIDFILMFLEANHLMDRDADDVEVTRIEFRYVEEVQP